MGDSHESEKSLKEARAKMSFDMQKILPEENLSYYESTNEMHCGPGEGGSKFEDSRVENILDVIQMRPDLPDKIQGRTDDREALLAAGAPESAFLPAIKNDSHPEGLPEALYYKVEGVEGRLGIISLGELNPDDRILIRREKGSSDKDARDYTPASFTVIRGTEEEMPKTDFATVIVGRAGGEEGNNEVWTVHPGAPIRPVMKEYEWTEDLRSPEELDGKKQSVRIMTVSELMEKGELNKEDFIKLVPGEMDEFLKEYDVVE